MKLKIRHHQEIEREGQKELHKSIFDGFIGYLMWTLLLPLCFRSLREYMDTKAFPLSRRDRGG